MSNIFRNFAAEILYMLAMELLEKEVGRQDFVDNAIMDLITDLNPSSKKIEWDIDMIGAIRDVVSAQLVSKGACTEEQFYP